MISKSKRQTLNTIKKMNKSYLFPHRFRVIGWVLACMALVAVFVFGFFYDFNFKMPALYVDDMFSSKDEKGFFQIAETGILTIAMPLMTIGLLFVGFSKEKLEDEFVQNVRSQSLIWSTYVTAILFVVATLLIYGIAYVFVPYLVFFVFLVLFIVKFRIELYRANKRDAQ